MALRREDRVNLHKKKDGIMTGQPSINDLPEGIPQFRTFLDHESGQHNVVQYIRHGAEILKSEFKRPSAPTMDQYAVWHLSDEVDISSTGTYKVLTIPDNTYVIDIRIFVTAAITAGSMDIDVGDGTNTDIYIDGWDGSSGSISLNAILLHGQASSVTESGVKTGKYYEDTDTLDILVNDAADSGKIKLLVLLMRNPFAEP